MRIVLLGPYPPYRGGIAHFAVSVRRELASRGHDVWQFTFSRQYPKLLFPGKTEFESSPTPDVLPATRVLDSINPLSWRNAGQRIRNVNADAVLYSYWHPFFAPAYGTVRRVSGQKRRHVALVHNVYPHERKPLDAALSRYFLGGCDGALTMSKSVERDVRQLVPGLDVRRVAHPTYDLFGEAPPKSEARKKLGLDAQAPVGLFFGFVRPYKGLETLIRALPEVLRAVPDFTLIVAGEFYEPRDRYDRLIEELGVRKHVRVVDSYIPAEEVGSYFAASDLVIQPYTSATQSGVAQIAWQYGRPLIVTDVGGLAEVVPHEAAGLVVPPGDADALAAAVIRFFGEGLAERLTQGAHRQRQKYSWDPLIDALESMMRGEA